MNNDCAIGKPRVATLIVLILLGFGATMNEPMEFVAMGDTPAEKQMPPHKIISRGEASGPYQAFPDMCRLENGQIVCVFYAGYRHASWPSHDWPKCGRICMVRSDDEGRTWSEPVIVYDDELDNRDPHIAQLKDGTVLCTFFSLAYKGDRKWDRAGVQLIRSTDGGNTWSEQAETLIPGDWGCSAPVRQMPDGTCILGVYYEGQGRAWGGVLRSADSGESWNGPVTIGKESGLYLDAETDTVLLEDGTLYAALRHRGNMHYATSTDLGLTWSGVKDIGFNAHAPHFTRLRSGKILLSHRFLRDGVKANGVTGLHVSGNEAKTWEPYMIDNCLGAYPSTVELADGSVLIVYYEEGSRGEAPSAIRAQRLKLTAEGLERLPLD